MWVDACPHGSQCPRLTVPTVHSAHGPQCPRFTVSTVHGASIHLRVVLQNAAAALLVEVVPLGREFTHQQVVPAHRRQAGREPPKTLSHQTSANPNADWRLPVKVGAYACPQLPVFDHFADLQDGLRRGGCKTDTRTCHQGRGQPALGQQ